MNQLFPVLNLAPFLPGTHTEVFVSAAGDFLANLNAIHPFREGNGRSQLAFLHLVALRAGHPLKLESIQPPEFLAAMVRSFQGQNDLLIAQLQALLV
jgi:cell filamentation protein